MPTQSLENAVRQMRQCLIASKNRRDLFTNANPNFPDTDRYTIEHQNLDRLKEYFFALQGDSEFVNLYPTEQYRFEVATSWTGGSSIHDFKISPIENGRSARAIFNFHIRVVSGQN